MAVLFIESFDKYGPAGQTTPTVASLLTAGEWNTIAGSFVPAIVAGLSGSGLALQWQIGSSNNVYLTRVLASNYPRLIGGLRFSTNALVQRSLVFFSDAGTTQCSIGLDTSGHIVLRTGNDGGAAIATSSVAITVNSIHYVEWDITFSATGAYQVWLDGASLFSGTGNTKTTANNYASWFLLGGTSAGGATYTGIFDDLYLFDSTGATNNAALLNNPVVETAFPNADSAKAWTNNASIIGVNNVTGGTQSPGANSIILRQFTAPASMTLNSVSCVPSTSSGGKYKAVLYVAATTGSARIAEGTEVVGTTSGTTLTLPFAAGQSLTGGTSYAIGFITDTNVPLPVSDAGNNSMKATNTYTSNSPATLPTMTPQPSFQIWGNCTGSAADYVNLNINPPVDDAAYLSSSTVGQQEMQAFPALASTPASIAVVAYKARVKRSDSGARTVEVHCASGAADTAGSTAGGITTGTSYSWLPIYLPTDPATGSPWTGTAVNAARAGVKVFS